MFYVLDILNCAAICSMPCLLREDPNFFDICNDNQQPQLPIGDCDRNFEIGKTTDEAKSLEVKIESYILSSTKDFISAMATMLATHCVFMLRMHQ